jgi:hypothetical protein
MVLPKRRNLKAQFWLAVIGITFMKIYPARETSLEMTFKANDIIMHAQKIMGNGILSNPPHNSEYIMVYHLFR